MEIKDIRPIDYIRVGLTKTRGNNYSGTYSENLKDPRPNKTGIGPDDISINVWNGKKNIKIKIF